MIEEFISAHNVLRLTITKGNYLGKSIEDCRKVIDEAKKNLLKYGDKYDEIILSEQLRTYNTCVIYKVKPNEDERNTWFIWYEKVIEAETAQIVQRATDQKQSNTSETASKPSELSILLKDGV